MPYNRLIAPKCTYYCNTLFQYISKVYFTLTLSAFSAANMIEEFGHKEEYSVVCVRTIETFSSAASLSNLNSSYACDQEPDLIEAYANFTSAFIRCCPKLLSHLARCLSCHFKRQRYALQQCTEEQHLQQFHICHVFLMLALLMCWNLQNAPLMNHVVWCWFEFWHAVVKVLCLTYFMLYLVYLPCQGYINLQQCCSSWRHCVASVREQCGRGYFVGIPFVGGCRQR